MTSGSTGTSDWIGAAAAAGPFILGLGVLVTLAGYAAGWERIGQPPFTLAEAAAAGRRPEILAAVRRGAALNGRYAVRAAFFGSERSFTPLEAAVAARREETVAFLLSLDGNLAGAEERARLACAALEADGAERVVEALFPDGFDRRACSLPR